MTIFRTQHNKNYTTVNNHICKDNRLSWKAKGIWLYAFSRPDDWCFYIEDIINHSTDGIDAVTSGLKELEKCGYLVRVRLRNSKGVLGKSEWTFFENPQDLNKLVPKPDYPNLDKPILDNPPLPMTDALPIPDIRKTMTAKTLSSKNKNIENESESICLKYKLKPEQRVAYLWLKGQSIDSDDNTLCYWAKTYSYERLKNVLDWARREKRDSIGAYIQKLLKSGAVVENDAMRDNKQLAMDYKIDNKWKSLKIEERFVSCVNDRNSSREINLDMPSFDFLNKLMEMHNWDQNKY